MASERKEISPLKILLFGPPTVRIGEQALPPLRSKKGMWLLSLLVLRHNREIARSWLAGTLWPHNPEELAFSSLRRSLTDLRHVLGVHANCLLAPTPSTLRLDTTAATSDVIAFDRDIASDDMKCLEEAVALYRGPLMEGCHEEWVFQERLWREEAYVTALEKLASLARQRNDYSAAERYLRRVISVYPWRETSQRALMETLAKSGDHGAVTLAYRDLRLSLRSEMNTDPDPETTALYQRLREEARRRAGESQISTTRVRDLAARAPSLRESIASHIPQPLTPLIGRALEISAIHARLATSRMVCLTGIGGVGKTRLAIELGSLQRSAWPGGVWFIDLAVIADEMLVPQTVATVFGLREQDDQPLLTTLIQYLQSRQALLLLDNCEHLLPACARLANSLLQNCPQVRILATSRQALGLTGEVVYPVPPLGIPGIARGADNVPVPLETLYGFHAVQLFVERATAVMPTFRLNAANASETMHICQQLDGIPLAIELAAARVKALTTAQIAARLENRFRLLSATNYAAQPRQQTLQSLMDWSYDLLAPNEKRLMCRLAVFAGSWTLEAAEAVCSDSEVAPEEVLDLMCQLVDKSLVLIEDRHSERRYRFLETVRQYGLVRLEEAAEHEAVSGRHRDWFLQFAETAALNWNGSEQAVWQARIEADYENLRRALQWSVDSETCLRFANALGPYWFHRGYFTEGRAWIENALSRKTSTPRSVLCAWVLLRAGAFSWRQGDFTVAEQYWSRCLDLVKEVEDPKLYGAVLHCLSLVAYEQGRITAAEVSCRESLALRETLGDRLDVLNTRTLLALLQQCQGRYQEARELHEQVLNEAEQMGATRSVISTLGNLAELACAEGDYPRAQSLWETCLERDRALDYRWGMASSLGCLGYVAYHRDASEEARRLYRQGFDLAQEVGDRSLIVRVVEGIAGLMLNEGDAAAAARLIGNAEAMRQAMGASRPLYLQQEYETDVARIREALGEERYETLCEDGRAMECKRLLETVILAPAAKI